MQERASGHLDKMAVSLREPVEYSMVFDEQKTPLNEWLGKTVSLKFSGAVHCVHCGRSTKKSFNQGYCYPCFKRLARCDQCILSPEKCHFHLGTCREPEWGERWCMTPHVVYLANSTGVKVGITRQSQIPTRWIDQGAVQALPVFTVNTRRHSGLIEDLIRREVTDRTNWRALLKGEADPVDLTSRKEEIVGRIKNELRNLVNSESEEFFEYQSENKMVSIEYPVLHYPEKVVSLNPEKQSEIEGTLIGIKGQYWLLDTGCINIRKFTGYEAVLSA